VIAVEDDTEKPKQKSKPITIEKYYQTIFFVICRLLTRQVWVEQATNVGPSIHFAALMASQNTRDERDNSVNPIMVSDRKAIVSNHAVLEFDQRIVIVELKVNQSGQAALEQIKEKKYADSYVRSGKEILLIGINFDSHLRNISDDWGVEIMPPNQFP